ncbi:hypothetical protein DACRYDRAFT_111956 [Dacryopinax primogenitus]|uniref:Uncharacterized protein n=1 Tax=Dacryopinax primogenitus (strain DJM 731) TaxID=1858805 RepID=M5FPY5_DACPD|nr:uncharacterized protein DACRYDRAFT_111956 [Dacryopinax primogenitus]EJT97413.1 hypothetical protein DACRYDRAFT_111956 [Dacryopinax primogenitus]
MPTGSESPLAPLFSHTSYHHPLFCSFGKTIWLVQTCCHWWRHKIDWACFYTNDDTYKLWAQIHDGMDDADKNLYEDFKTKILNYYPGMANNEHWYATQDLDDLVHKWQCRIKTKGEFAKFYWDFFSISTSLIKHNRISILNQQKFLLRILKFLPPKSCLWDKMLNRLKQKYDRAVDKPWTIAELKETVEWALGNTTTKVRPPSPNYLQDASPAPVPVNVKTESNPQVANITGHMANLEGMVSHIYMLMNWQPAMQNQLATQQNSYGQPSQNTYGNNTLATGTNQVPVPAENYLNQNGYGPQNTEHTLCHFDRVSTGCMDKIVTCPGAQKYVEEGLLEKDSTYHVLTGSQFIPCHWPGQDLKEKVDNYYKDHPEHCPKSQATLSLPFTT